MKSSLFVFVVLFAVTSQSAPAASMVREVANSQISRNQELKEVLLSMGHTQETAVDAFAAAAEVLEAKGEKVNYGTLAICGEVKARFALFGTSATICTSLFNAYSVGHAGLGSGDFRIKDSEGLSLSLSLTGKALYFRTEDGDEKGLHCFAGLDVLVGVGKVIGGSAATQLDCDELNNKKFKMKKGFLAAFRYGVGTATDYTVGLFYVKHLHRYNGLGR